jgi:hypothetical protein
MDGDNVSGCGGDRWWLSGPHMSPIFISYNHTSMQNKITFMKLREIRILMIVFFCIFFSVTMVNITYGGFHAP